MAASSALAHIIIARSTDVPTYRVQQCPVNVRLLRIVNGFGDPQLYLCGSRHLTKPAWEFVNGQLS